MSMFNKYYDSGLTVQEKIIAFFIALSFVMNLVIGLNFLVSYLRKDKPSTMSKERYEGYVKELDEWDYEKSDDKNWSVYHLITDTQGWKFDRQKWDIKETGNNLIPLIATTKAYFSKGEKIRIATLSLVCSPYSYPDCKILGSIGEELDYDKYGYAYYKTLNTHYKLEENE